MESLKKGFKMMYFQNYKNRRVNNKFSKLLIVLKEQEKKRKKSKRNIKVGRTENNRENRIKKSKLKNKEDKYVIAAGRESSG
jgi:hypothetical protein